MLSSNWCINRIPESILQMKFIVNENIPSREEASKACNYEVKEEIKVESLTLREGTGKPQNEWKCSKEDQDEGEAPVSWSRTLLRLFSIRASQIHNCLRMLWFWEGASYDWMYYNAVKESKVDWTEWLKSWAVAWLISSVWIWICKCKVPSLCGTTQGSFSSASF